MGVAPDLAQINLVLSKLDNLIVSCLNALLVIEGVLHLLPDLSLAFLDQLQIQSVVKWDITLNLTSETRRVLFHVLESFKRKLKLASKFLLFALTRLDPLLQVLVVKIVLIRVVDVISKVVSELRIHLYFVELRPV